MENDTDGSEETEGRDEEQHFGISVLLKPTHEAEPEHALEPEGRIATGHVVQRRSSTVDEEAPSGERRRIPRESVQEAC